MSDKHSHKKLWVAIVVQFIVILLLLLFVSTTLKNHSEKIKKVVVGLSSAENLERSLRNLENDICIHQSKLRQLDEYLTDRDGYKFPGLFSLKKEKVDCRKF